MNETNTTPVEPDAWSFEHEVTVMMFTDQRLTISVVLEEEDRPPPVMFSSKKSLMNWVCQHGLHADKLKDHDENKALHVYGEYHAKKTRSRYEHVWVLSRYDKYGVAQNDAIDLFYRVAGVDPTTLNEEPEEDQSDVVSPSEAMKAHKIDADHVINRSSLKEHQPEAWVLLFPVPRNANRGFGAKFERYYPSVSAATDRLDLPPPVAFKLFCGAMP